MKTQNPDNRGRNGLGFQEAVQQYLAPMLTARGFACTEQKGHSTEFQSKSVTFTVFHDPISYEIDLCYARQDAPLERYNLRNMLDTFLGPGHEAQALFQASDGDRVVTSMKMIVDLLQKYGEAVLDGSPTVYRRIGDLSRMHNEAFTKQVVQGPIRAAAEDAWQRHDFVRARDLYESIEADLTLCEKKRLNYARSHSLGP